MARPKEFDEVSVLDAAAQQFWSHGYEATSVRDLTRVTGLTSASLYNAFGNKEQLFRRSFDHYLEHVLGNVPDVQARGSALERVRAFFNDVIACTLSDDELKGCLLVNTALEVAPHDPAYRQIVNRSFAGAEAFFAGTLAIGQAAGSIAANVDPDDFAKLLLGLLLGIRVLARTKPSRELLEGMVRPAMTMLEPLGRSNLQ